jgi:ParB family transcriptional regulator, chromosome partitioning protein
MQHELKCVIEPFQAKWEKKKSWEFRKNDRDFRVGDYLLEREYDPNNNTYTGREILEEVTWILPGGSFGVPADCVIMSTREESRCTV